MVSRVVGTAEAEAKWGVDEDKEGRSVTDRAAWSEYLREGLPRLVSTDILYV